MLVRSTFHRLSSPIVNYSKHTKALFSKSDYASTSIIHVTYRTNLFTTHRLLSSQSKSDIKQENWKQVYYGSLTPQIKAVKFFSLSSSVVGVVAQPFLYTEIASLSSLSITLAAYSFIGFFTVVTPILLHMMTKKYVTDMNYNANNDTYSAKTYNFFCIPKETVFKVSDVEVPDVPGMFTSIIAKNRPLFLDPQQFQDASHYAKIMGYDKPIDFKLYENPENKQR